MTPEAFAENIDLPLVESVMKQMAVRPCCFYVLNLEEKTPQKTKRLKESCTTVPVTSRHRSLHESYEQGVVLRL